MQGASNARHARLSYRGPDWQELLDCIDLEAMLVDARIFDRPAGPHVATLDTSFFFSCFQSVIRWGGPPRSIGAAKDGTVRLFMAEETLSELIEILPEFAQKIGVDEQRLKSILDELAPWIWVVSLDHFDDPRVEAVAKRDAADLPAARLAAFLSPCFLLTTDKDFKAMEVQVPCQPVLAIKAAVLARRSETTVEVVGAIPAVPVLAAWEGAKWGGSKLGVHPALLILGILALGFVVYDLQPADRRSRIRSSVIEGCKAYATVVNSANEENRLAEKAVNLQLVPRVLPQTPESRVIGELARHEEPMSAQRIYDHAGLRDQVSVKRIREVLRTHESTWRCPGNGQWSFGIPMSEYLHINEND